MIGDVFDYILGEWAIIPQVPATFAAAIVVCALLVWWLCRSLYSGQIKALNERIRLRDDQIFEVQRKLTALTPSDALIKLGDLTARHELLSSGVWEPLTSDQISQLEEKISNIPPGNIYIRIIDNGRMLGRQLEQLFLKMRWEVVVSRGMSGRAGISVLSRSPYARSIGEALQSLGLEVDFSDGGEEIKITVGDKPIGPLLGDQPGP